MAVKRLLAPLRWSVINTFLFPRTFARTGQFGDGREAAVAEYVLTNVRQGDIDAVLDAMDRFAYDETFLISVGDEKGELLDAAVRRADTRLALELGTYCGYGALRIARAAPTARVFSVEWAEANAAIARRIWAHAGVDDRITCVVGMIGDGGRTLRVLEEHGFAAGALDLLFLDHIKSAYLPDLHSITERGWLHPGVDRGRRQRTYPGRAEVPRVHAATAGHGVRHDRAQNPRRVPDGGPGSHARIGRPGLTAEFSAGRPRRQSDSRRRTW